MTARVEMAHPQTGPRTAAAVLALASGRAGLAVAVAVVVATTATDLTHVNRGLSPWSPGGRLVTTSDGVDGLRAGDEIVTVEGASAAWWLAERPWLTRPGAAPDPGTALVYEVRRPGEPRPRTVPVELAAVPVAEAVRANWAALVLVGLMVGVNGYVFLRRPRAPAAQVMLVMAMCMLIQCPGWVLGLAASDLARGPGLLRWAASGLVFALMYGLVLHFVLIFPAPHRWLPGRAWLIPAGYALPLALRGGVALVGAGLTEPGWQRLQAQLVPTLPEQLLVPALVVVLLAAGWTSVRDPAERAQLRLVGVAVGTAQLTWIGLCLLPEAARGAPLVAPELQPLLHLPIPLAIAAAVLRHRMLEITGLVNRSLVWGLLSAGVIGTYISAVWVLNLFLAQRASLLASLIATAVVAVAFQPARQALQAAVDRLMYGHRHEPYRALTDLADRIGATATPQEVLPRAVESIARALRLPRVSIELRDAPAISWPVANGTSGPDPERPGPPDPPERFTLIHQGTVVGHLAVQRREPGRPLSAADRSLLAGMVGHLGVAAHSVQLGAALSRSREELLTAREEERHRIHHDLHDRLGPTLAGIALQLEVTASRLPPDQAGTTKVLQGLLAETRAAIGDVRRLVYGLRPTAVHELGLVGALEAKAAMFSGPADGAEPRRARFSVVAGPLPATPLAVERAVYRIAVEAMTNVIRHAGAGHCTVTLDAGEPGGALRLEVTDDGVGPPDPLTPGVGVSSMIERAAALGGWCRVQPGPLGGTTVRAVLPLTATARPGGERGRT